MDKHLKLIRTQRSIISVETDFIHENMTEFQFELLRIFSESRSDGGPGPSDLQVTFERSAELVLWTFSVPGKRYGSSFS